MAGFESGAVKSGGTSAAEMAGFAVCLLGRPGCFTAIPASRRYRVAVSRLILVSRSIRRSDQPIRPRANTCCLCSSLKTLLIRAEDGPSRSRFALFPTDLMAGLGCPPRPSIPIAAVPLPPPSSKPPPPRLLLTPSRSSSAPGAIMARIVRTPPSGSRPRVGGNWQSRIVCKCAVKSRGGYPSPG